MDVCLPEEFLRLTRGDDADTAARRDDWFGADAWVSASPVDAARSIAQLIRQDDPIWRVG